MTSDDSAGRDTDGSPSADDDLRVPVKESYEAAENRLERLLADFYAD